MADNTTSSSKSQDGSILAQNAATSPTNSSTTSTSSSSSNRPYTLKHANSLITSGGTSAGSGTNTGAGGGSGKHHHHHHHHNYHHHHHGHHHGSSNSHVIHRTTSESLRLGTEIGGTGSGGGGGGGSSNSCGGGGGGSATTSLSSSKNNNCGNGGGSSSSGANNNNNSSHSVNPSSHHHQLILNTPILSAPQSGGSSIQRKPKTSSFQIISVTDGSSSKLSTDNGEDSADDLDESHTDDNSRITDFENETPSFSEDTFSKEDVFFSSNALGTAPVIPTSSQYGLVIVDPDLGGVGAGPGQNISNVHVSVTDAGINIVGPGVAGKLGDGDQKDLHHRNERFKVVKIESTEPFKRGRWMCMDYLDHSTLQQPAQGKDTPTSGGATNDSGVVVTENHIDSGGEPPDVPSNYSTMSSTTNINSSPGQTLQNPINVGGTTEQQQNNAAVSAPSPSVAGAVGGAGVTLAGIAGGVAAGAGLHAQTVTHMRNVVTGNVQPQNTPTQSLPQTQIQQAITGQSQVPHGQPQTSQPASDFQQQNSHQGQSQPAQFYTNNQIVGQNMSATQMHGATLPSNINVQHGVPTSLIPQNQQQSQIQPQQAQPPAQQTPTVQQSQASQGVSITIQPSATMAEQQIASAIPQNVIPASSVGTQSSGNMIATGQITNSATNIMQSQSVAQSQVGVDCYLPNQQQQTQSYAAQPMSAANVSTISNSASIVPTHSEISQQSQPQQPVEIATGNTPVQSTVISPVGTASSTPQQNQPPQQSAICEEAVSIQSQQVPLQIPIQDNMSQHQQAQITAMNDAMAAAATAIQAQQQAQAASLQTQQSIATNEEGLAQAAENDSESASGTSAVAIDNKIEQAMDLVKSHLMIAVREEVEVLKEKIAELMDRINQLELENTILKANVSQETLSQLSATMQQTASKTPQNTNTSNGPVS